MKTCVRCKIDKPLSEFTYRTDKSKGHRAHCNACLIAPTHRFCGKCKQTLPVSEFRVNKETGAYPPCNRCSLKYQREWRFKTLYGISTQKYESMLFDQFDLCGICGFEIQDRPLVVDHNHKTGSIRGLLCDKCNRGLGFFDDDPERMLRAARYLREEKPQVEFPLV